AIPRHKLQWPFIGSIVDYINEKRSGRDLPEMPRNVALPFVMGSKNEYPPLRALTGPCLELDMIPGMRISAPKGPAPGRRFARAGRSRTLTSGSCRPTNWSLQVAIEKARV